MHPFPSETKSVITQSELQAQDQWLEIHQGDTLGRTVPAGAVPHVEDLHL